MGIANSLAAIEAGASRIDGSAAGLGAGAGNTPLEVFVAVLDRMGVEHGVDLYKVMDVAEDLVVPMMDAPGAHRPGRAHPRVRGRVLVVPALREARRRSATACRRGTSSSRWARRKTVGGQEDMIEDVALDLARAGGR